MEERTFLPVGSALAVGESDDRLEDVTGRFWVALTLTEHLPCSVSNVNAMIHRNKLFTRNVRYYPMKVYHRGSAVTFTRVDTQPTAEAAH